jgi:hypothetical protein
MKRRSPSFIPAVAILTLTACRPNEPQVPNGQTRGELSSTLSRAKRSGAHNGPWRTGDLFVSREPSGAFRVTRGKPWDPRMPVRGVSTASLKNWVEGRIAADPPLAGAALRVDADENGLVTLRGRVRHVELAARAIEDALETGGVSAVDSFLEW